MNKKILYSIVLTLSSIAPLSAMKHEPKTPVQKLKKSVQFRSPQSLTQVELFPVSPTESKERSEHWREINSDALSYEEAKKIIESGTIADFDGRGVNAIHRFATCSNPDGLKMLLKVAPEFVNTCTNDGQKITPLHYAAYSDQPDNIEVLFAYNATIEQDNNGLTPLHYAAMKDSYEATKTLIEYMTVDQLVQESHAGYIADDYAAACEGKRVWKLLTNNEESYE